MSGTVEFLEIALKVCSTTVWTNTSNCQINRFTISICRSSSFVFCSQIPHLPVLLDGMMTVDKSPGHPLQRFDEPSRSVDAAGKMDALYFKFIVFNGEVCETII